MRLMCSLQLGERGMSYMSHEIDWTVELDSDVTPAVARANEPGAKHVFALLAAPERRPNNDIFRPNHKQRSTPVLARYLQFGVTDPHPCARVADILLGNLGVKNVLASHEPGDKLAVGLAQQLIQSADLLQDAAVQYGGPVRHGESLFQIMAHVNGRQAELTLNLQQLGTDFLPGHLV
jgi:hypothetical protein